MLWKPDQTFYPSPRLASEGPRERLGYVASFSLDPAHGKRDAINVLDLDPASPTFATVVGRVEVSGVGDELHHFGWNACSSALCPYSPHPHVERRYLLVPGLRSSRIHVIDTKPDPRAPKIVKVIEPEEIASRAGYSRPHTIHCGPDAIYVSAMGGGAHGGGPGGVFLLDHESFEVLGQWEVDRGPQFLAYDFWWHIGYDVGVSSEWGTPDMFENGLSLERLVKGDYGHRLHMWDLRKRRHLQEIDLGAEHQMALELRPAHDPTKAYGFVCTVISTKDLSAGIWLWHRAGNNGKWAAQKVIEIPAEPADPDLWPPPLKQFKAAPPLVPEIALSLDDKFLYASCWGTGELKQYDVSDPFHPRLTGSVHIGGIVRRAPHPAKPDVPLNGGPQMVELSRDGRRVYFTNSLYRSWDEQFYPDGIKGWMVKLDVSANGGIQLDPHLLTDFGDRRPHQVRLQGGDA